MADRSVKVVLTATTAGYTVPIKDASATTLKLAAAQKEEAAAAKAAAAETVSAAQKIALAEKQAALAAAEASAKSVAGDEATAAAKKAVEAASKDLAKQETASAKAVSAAQREAKAANTEAVAAQKAIDDAAKKTGESYVNTGKKMSATGLALVGVFGLAEKATSDFDAAMSGVGAVANATATQMDQLRGAALQAGKDTAFTAKEAADAEDELVKAGVSVQDILNGGLQGALSLAAAGQLSLANAATISANAMNVFGLKGSDVGHIADVLAAGANKSAAGVQSLAFGMSQGGLVASQLGLSLEDTTAVLSAFADRGLEGADAGTSMKTMLERLGAPTGAAKKQLDGLGISVYDAQGKFVGITSIAGQLHDTLGQLTEAQRNQALQTIFGSDAIRGATVLYNLGADGMKNYVGAVNDSGAASRMASMQLDNLGGDLHQLRGSIDVALIQGGSGGNAVLREMAQDATKAVNAFAGLPKPLQEAAVSFAGGSGAALLLVGGMVTAAGKVGAMRKSLSELEETATGAKGALAKVGSFMTGPWGLAIAGAVTMISLFASKENDAKVQVADFTQAIKDDGNALGAHTTQAVAADLANRGVYDSFGKLGVSMNTVTQAAMGNADALKAVGEAAAKSLKSGNAIDSAGLVKQLAVIEATANGLHDQQHAQLQATAATQDAAAASSDDAAVQARLARSAQDAALRTMQHVAAARAAADAARAEGADTDTATAATKGSTAAKGASTKAAKDATAATKADSAAQRAQAGAQKAANTAANDAAKAAAANAKAQRGNADATNTNSYANSTAAGAAKNAAAATRDKTQAQNADTTSANANISANQAASRAHDAAARAADAHAKAAKDAAAAAGDDAAAQAAAAEAAREAAFEHEIGTAALKGWAEAANHVNDSTNSLDKATTAEVAAMKDAQTAASTLKDALDALNGVHVAAGRAAVDVQNKVADLTKAFDKNGKTLDITTQAGRDNMSAVYDLADAISQHAQAVAQETGSVDAGNKALQASRDEFDKVLSAAGISKDAIQAFNNELLAIPKTIPVALTVDSATALSELQTFKDQLGNITGVHIGGTTGRALYSSGGLVEGVGTTTSDSNPVMVSRREYILSAAATARIGVDNLNRMNFGGAPAALVRPQYIGAIGGTTSHAAGAAASAPLRLVVAGGADSAVATMFMNLVRTGAIQIQH